MRSCASSVPAPSTWPRLCIAGRSTSRPSNRAVSPGPGAPLAREPWRLHRTSRAMTSGVFLRPLRSGVIDGTGVARVAVKIPITLAQVAGQGARTAVPDRLAVEYNDGNDATGRAGEEELGGAVKLVGGEVTDDHRQPGLLSQLDDGLPRDALQHARRRRAQLAVHEG